MSVPLFPPLSDYFSIKIFLFSPNIILNKKKGKKIRGFYISNIIQLFTLTVVIDKDSSNGNFQLMVLLFLVKTQNVIYKYVLFIIFPLLLLKNKCENFYI